MSLNLLSNAAAGRRLVAIGGAVLALTIVPARAAEAETPTDETRSLATARDIIARLDRRLRSVTTMRGRFVQTFVSSGLGMPQSESGRFWLSRPDRMRWEYTKPELKTAVSDGTHTWLHVPEDNVVYRGSVSEWRQGGAFAVLSEGRIGESFEARGLETAAALKRGDVVLILRPSAPRDDYETLLIEVEPGTLRIAAVTAVDSMGNRIGAAFSDIEENVALAPDLFRFTPPPGARVLDQNETGAPE